MKEMRWLFIPAEDEKEPIDAELRRLHITAMRYERPQDFDVTSEEEINFLVEYINKNRITHLISIHYLVNVACAAYKTGIKYAAIIWDAPYLKVYSIFAKLDNSWISTFDKFEAKRFQEYGCPHVIYQPLTVFDHDVRRWRLKRNKNYLNEVCFVARLYDNNAYDIELKDMPEIMHKYFDSIFQEAAFRWDGVNRIYGNTTPEILQYIKQTTPKYSGRKRYDADECKMFDALYLVRKVANYERIITLNTLAEYFNVTLHTVGSPALEKLRNVNIQPPLINSRDMYRVFLNSKINLNISLKGIEGGTPQRVIDILGAGGFCLTNYSEETLELFEEGKEIATFKSPEELVEKIDYYLKHDEERETIAAAGQKKVLENFTYAKKLRKLIQWMEPEYEF